MRFLALLKCHNDTASKLAFWKFAEEKGGNEGKWELPEGVKIIDGFRLFGRYDAAILYEAPDEKTSMAFLSEMWNYADIEKFLTTTCPWCENAKKAQEQT